MNAPSRKLCTAPLPAKWTRSLTALFTATSVLILTASCAQTPPSSARAPLDATLTSPCPPLSPLADGTGGAVLRKLIEVGQMYKDCADAKARLVEAVR